MNTTDIIADIIIDMGCKAYITDGWQAMRLYPNLYHHAADKIIINLNDRDWIGIMVEGTIVNVTLHAYEGLPEEFSVDLADPDSIAKFKTIIGFKDILKDTSSPA